MNHLIVEIHEVQVQFSKCANLLVWNRRTTSTTIFDIAETIIVFCQIVYLVRSRFVQCASQPFFSRLVRGTPTKQIITCDVCGGGDGGLCVVFQHRLCKEYDDLTKIVAL